MPCDEDIQEYWRRFSDIVQRVDTLLVRLRPPSVRRFVREHTAIVREGVWDKIARHVYATPVARELECSREDVPVEFWVR